MDANQSARDETYRRFLALLDQTFPGRLTINLDDAARFLTEHVGVPTSTEMARVYAKSGRLIPGLRKSPAATWLFPLPALAAGLADGFLGATEPAPDFVRSTALAKRETTKTVVVGRGGRPRRSTLGLVVSDGWLIDFDGDQERYWQWSTDNLAPSLVADYDPNELRNARKRQARERSRSAWRALFDQILFLDGQRRAKDRLADLATRPATSGTERQHV